MNAAPRRPPPPIPVHLLTGFLGAGKTTLLNALLRDPALADTMVIINEFGEIGLDHLLVEKSEDGMLLLSSGCLCCTIRGELVTTLEDLLRRIDNGRMKPFSRLVIETTGLADPAPILQTLIQHPYLSLRYRLDGIITLVDAVNGAASLDAHEEALKQAAVADRIVITKTDLAAPETVAALRRRLEALNPGAVLLDGARGEARAERLLDAGPSDPAAKGEQVRNWLNAAAYETGHGHHHGHHDHDDHHGHDHGHHHEGEQHGHDVNRHDARIRAFCLTFERPVDPPVFDLFLELLRGAHGPNLLRMKGLVMLSDDPERPVVLHGVQTVFHPVTRLDAWPDGERLTRMVFILKDLDPAFVEQLWGAFTGAIGVDQPDAAALAHNPLKPAAGGLLD